MKKIIERLKQYFFIDDYNERILKFDHDKELQKEYAIKRRRWHALVILILFMVLLIRLAFKYATN